MLLVNNFGRVLEVDEEQAAKFLTQNRMRKPTEAEIQKYHGKVARRAIEADAEAKATSIYFQTVKASADGYGMSRDKIIEQMFKQGIYLSENFTDQKIGMIYGYPHSITALRSDVRLIYTMFESDKIPEDWPDYLNQADEVLVPSKFCYDVFKAAGVDSTIVPLGYDDSVFDYHERNVPAEAKRPFTFLHFNSFVIRKGFAEVVKAFEDEFQPDENVRLILKTNQKAPMLKFNKAQYPNVDVITGDVHEQKLAEIIHSADCLVYPSQGEGFGITPLEAMATGVPAIVPNAHGISEYFNAAYMLEAKVEKKAPALMKRFQGQNVGNFVVCDVKQLRRQMRYAFTHQHEMHDLGKAASQYVKNYTYKHTAERLAQIIRKWQRTSVVRKADEKVLRVVEI